MCLNCFAIRPLVETQIVRLKQDKPSWGAPKIRERLTRLYPDVHTPAISTVHVVLDRHGLVRRRTRRRNRATGTALCLPGQPNELWCADYKGEFMLADRRYCYPFTITDSASRYIFACEVLSPPRKPTPFRCSRPCSNSSACPRLSALIMVCLSPVRIRSSTSPSDRSGGCDSASRSSASSLATRSRTAGKNLLQQQAKFDDFVECYNNERPHQALDMRCPAECYVPSTRPYAGLPELEYPFHDKTVTVTTCGRICFNRQKIKLSLLFAGQKVGIKRVSEEIWLVTFMDYDLGYFDHETCRLEPLDNPFGPKVLSAPAGTARLAVDRSQAARERAPIAP